MATRMTSMTVEFRRPFMLNGFEQIEPAGSYLVETEEESIDDVSMPVWRRMATIMHVTRGGATEYRRIDPIDLAKALSRDHAQEETPVAAQHRLEAVRRRNSSRLAHRKKF